MGLAEDILSLKDLKTEVVQVKEWDKELTIRELDLEQGINLLSMATEIEESLVIGPDQIARVVVWGVINPDTGDPVFTEKQIPKLMKKNRNPIMRLYNAITTLSNEDAEKN